MAESPAMPIVWLQSDEFFRPCAGKSTAHTKASRAESKESIQEKQQGGHNLMNPRENWYIIVFMLTFFMYLKWWSLKCNRMQMGLFNLEFVQKQRLSEHLLPFEPSWDHALHSKLPGIEECFAKLTYCYTWGRQNCQCLCHFQKEFLPFQNKSKSSKEVEMISTRQMSSIQNCSYVNSLPTAIRYVWPMANLPPCTLEACCNKNLFRAL